MQALGIESFALEVWIFRNDKGHRPCDCASNIQSLYSLLLRSVLPCGNSSDHTWNDEEMDLYLFVLSHHLAEHKRAFKLKSLWTDTTFNRNRKKKNISPLYTSFHNLPERQRNEESALAFTVSAAIVKGGQGTQPCQDIVVDWFHFTRLHFFCGVGRRHNLELTLPPDEDYYTADELQVHVRLCMQTHERVSTFSSFWQPRHCATTTHTLAYAYSGFWGVSYQTTWYARRTRSFVHKAAVEAPLHHWAWTPCVSLIGGDRFLEKRLPAVHSCTDSDLSSHEWHSNGF